MSFLILLFVAPFQDDLEIENRRLKSQIRALERKLQAAEAAGFHYTEKGYSSCLQAVKKLPNELKPPALEHWRSIDSAAGELQLLMVGKPFTAKHRVTIEIKHKHKAELGKPPYDVTCTFNDVELPHKRRVFVQKLYPLTFDADDDDLEHLRKLNGRTITVTGVCKSIKMKHAGYPKNHVNVYVALTQVTHSPVITLD